MPYDETLGVQISHMLDWLDQIHHRWEESPHERVDLIPEILAELQTSLEELSVADAQIRQQSAELSEARLHAETNFWRYHHLFNYSPDGYLVTDLWGKILEANPAFASLLGIQQKFLIGKPLGQYILLSHRPAFRKKLNDLRLNYGQDNVDKLLVFDAPLVLPGHWEFSLQPRLGDPFHASLNVTVTHSGEERVLRWTIRSIETRTLTERALHASEVRFTTLTDSIPAAVLLLHQGQIFYANPAATLVSGYSQEHLVGSSFQDLLHPDDQKVISDQLLQIIEQHSFSKPVYNRRQVRLLSSNGQTVWLDLALGIMQIDEQPLQVITAYDITLRVQAEQKLKINLRLLDHLQEDERRRISRELHDQAGQNLTVLTLGLKALEDHLPPGSPGWEVLQQLQQVTNELGREVHQVAFELRPSSLDDLGLKQTLSNYAEAWSQRTGIAVDTEETGKKDISIPAPVATTLFRIVQEAFNNIAKHAQATRVTLLLDQHEDRVRLVIEDNGLGFSLDQVLRSSKRLGLLGMKERAELLNGTWNIETAPGKGTTLYITIPLQTGHADDPLKNGDIEELISLDESEPAQ